MNKHEKKLRKIKGLYEMLNNKNQLAAERKAKEGKCWNTSSYVVFDFIYKPDNAWVELNWYRYQVSYHLWSNKFNYGHTGNIDNGNLLDIFWGGGYKGFDGCPRFYDNIQSTIKFVRNALKNGIDSMNYGTYTETVRLTNYLDFEEKENNI